MLPTKLKNPPKPMVLLDALYYRRGKSINLGNDGNWRWSARYPIPRWARAGRVAAPFNQALKLYDLGKPQSQPEQTWHDRIDHGDEEQVCSPAPQGVHTQTTAKYGQQ